MGKIAGIMQAFDRHLNLILINAVESYSAIETVLISTREKDPLKLLARFLRNHGIKTPPEQVLKQHVNVEEMWTSLYSTYGVTAQISKLLDGNEELAKLLLRTRAGYDEDLVKQLTLKKSGLDLPPVDETADWVCLPSEKYRGQVFYYNNKTKTSEWTQPNGVEFHPVKILKKRNRPVGTIMVRGDIVATVSLSPPLQQQRGDGQ